MTTRAPAPCQRCAADVPGDATHCPGCGTRVRRRPIWGWVAAIVMGLSLQIAMVILLLRFPPGTTGGVLAYLAMGVVGFLELLFGAFGLRRARSALPDAAPMHAHLEDGADLPRQALHCPSCNASLARAVERRQRRCPQCNRHFSLRDLDGRAHDPAGEPASLAPGERRLDGRGVAIVVLVLLLLVVAAWAGVSALPSPNTPPQPPSAPGTPGP